MSIGSSACSTRSVIESWRIEYNTERPHSSLNNKTPEEWRPFNYAGRTVRRAFPPPAVQLTRATRRQRDPRHACRGADLPERSKALIKNRTQRVRITCGDVQTSDAIASSMPCGPPLRDASHFSKRDHHETLRTYTRYCSPCLRSPGG